MTSRITTPSKKQAMVLQLINQGMQKKEAMLKAGYSESTARNPKQNVVKSKALITMADRIQLELHDAGLTTEYIAKKILQFTKARKTDKADYFTQVRGIQMAKDIYGLKQDNNDSKVKRKITLEEFIEE